MFCFTIYYLYICSEENTPSPGFKHLKDPGVETGNIRV